MAFAAVFIGFATVALAGDAAPPAAASVSRPSASASVRSPALSLGATEPTSGYQLIATGLLARTLFATANAGPISVEMLDLLVGPGQIARLPNGPFAALLDVEAGSAVLLLGGERVATETGSAISIAQGQTIVIDNRRGHRNFLARLIKLSAKGG